MDYILIKPPLRGLVLTVGLPLLKLMGSSLDFLDRYNVMYRKLPGYYQYTTEQYRCGTGAVLNYIIAVPGGTGPV